MYSIISIAECLGDFIFFNQPDYKSKEISKKNEVIFKKYLKLFSPLIVSK
jgi:hypothetical protein